jgi:transposase
MGSSRRKFPREFKVNALKRLEAGASMAEVARSCQVDPNILWRWRRDFIRAPESAFPGPGRSPDESRIAELQREIERHVQEIDYLKQYVQRMEKRNDASA